MLPPPSDFGAAEIVAICVGVAGILGTIAGVLLGASSSRSLAREIAQDERTWQSEQAVLEREERAAERLREDLIEIQEKVPGGAPARPSRVQEPLGDAHRSLREAWTRASVLRNDEIDQAFFAADMCLFIALQDCAIAKHDHGITTSPVRAALKELRILLDAFLRREDLPPRQVPSTKKLIELAEEGLSKASTSPGMDAITRYMVQNTDAL